VLGPACSLGDVTAALQGRGFGPGRSTSTLALPTLVPGEPEMLLFTHPSEDVRVAYDFHPVVGMRTLTIRGSSADDWAAALAQTLPCLGERELVPLLDSDDARELLLGLYAAAELGAFALLPVVRALFDHSDQHVAAAARRTAERLIGAAADEGAARIQVWQRVRPGRSALIGALPSVAARRQALRWLPHSVVESPQGVDRSVVAALRSGLQDRDWEVRLTAVLIAARLGVRELASDAARVELPRSGREGLTRDERHVIEALRKLAVGILRDRLGLRSAAPSHERAFIEHLRRCVLGEPVERHDQPWLLAHALTTPLDIEVSCAGAPAAPPGAPAMIALAWVPPVDHWLGDESVREFGSVAWEIRRFTPARGFFIATAVIPDAGTIADAEQRCAELSARLGRLVRLPTPDEHEAAVRGPDARLRSTGLSVAEASEPRVSPWGVEPGTADAPVWTRTLSGIVYLSSGPQARQRAAHCAVAAEGARAALRYLVEPIELDLGAS
jgi:hypothetical protein